MFLCIYMEVYKIKNYKVKGVTLKKVKSRRPIHLTGKRSLKRREGNWFRGRVGSRDPRVSRRVPFYQVMNRRAMNHQQVEKKVHKKGHNTGLTTQN